MTDKLIDRIKADRKALEEAMTAKHDGLRDAYIKAMEARILADAEVIEALRKALTDIDELSKRSVGCGGIARAALNKIGDQDDQ